jgi:starch synthase
LRIAFITPELQSLVRRTNLAGVAESLAKAFAAAKQDVRVLLPWTASVDSELLGPLSQRAEVRVKGGTYQATFRVLEGRLGELPVLLFEQPTLFGTRHPYGSDEGPYEDNWRRYALFTRAALKSLTPLDFVPDVLHGMDWTAGLLPLYHKLDYVDVDPDGPMAQAGTFFAIHNLAMQGVFEREILSHIDVPHALFKGIGGVELAGKVNFLKTGAEFATIIGTHSPSHAEKIQLRDRGYGLEDTFQRRRKELVGIHNGIDYQAWDPATDAVLPANFKPTDRELAGKKKCKAALQALLKLDAGPRTPIACSIGRWDADSGFDLLAEVLSEVLERNVELVIMGQGSPEMQQRLRSMESAFVGRLRVIDGYNAATAHLIMGGSDVVLLPSHYQPSNPMFAIGMRYGVVPIVYARSGLEDTVPDFDHDKRAGLGFHFESYTGPGLMEGVNNCLGAWKDAEKWRTLVRRCLNQDFSWSRSAEEYLKAYRRVTRRSKTRQESA